jgi:hypothetical protein
VQHIDLTSIKPLQKRSLLRDVFARPGSRSFAAVAKITISQALFGKA